VPPRPALRLGSDCDARADADAGSSPSNTDGMTDHVTLDDRPIWLEWEPFAQGDIELYELDTFTPDLNHSVTATECRIPAFSASYELGEQCMRAPPLYSYFSGAVYAVVRVPELPAPFAFTVAASRRLATFASAP
jgi:hypothetical protein